MEFKIQTDDKPYLDELLRTNKQLAKEIIGTFVGLMEESIEKGWHELPSSFSKELTFKDLVKGILNGSLSLPDINPESYDVLKEEVHPLSMLSPRKNYLDGGYRYHNWRNHYKLDPSDSINQETIEKIFRKLLRYYKYVDIDSLAKALINNQVKTWEGLGERNVQNLPFLPALRYQLAHFGELHVGLFFDEVGFLDGGEWFEGDSNECPACQHEDIQQVGSYKVCLSCNIGFKEKAL